MNRIEYRKLFESCYQDVQALFKEKDDRLVVDQLVMFFGFSEPKDYFDLPQMGRMTLALSNFDEAFTAGGISEFIENCGYCIPEVPFFFRLLEFEELARVFDGILTDSNPNLWGTSFFEHENEVSEYSRSHQWFRKESENVKNEEIRILAALRRYLQINIALFERFTVPGS